MKRWLKYALGTLVMLVVTGNVIVHVRRMSTNGREVTHLFQGPQEPSQAAPLSPASPPMPEAPPSAPLPPKSLASEPWLAVADPPLDCAEFKLEVEAFKPDYCWLWKPGTTEAVPLRSQNFLRMSLWAVPADGAVAVYSARDGWFLARVEQSSEWAWIQVPDPWRNDNPGKAGGLLVKAWDYPLDDHVPTHPKPDRKGWTTYNEIEAIVPSSGEDLRTDPNPEATSQGPLRLLEAPTLGLRPLKMIKFKGDWVQVEEPLEITEDRSAVGPECIPLLKVRWNPDRVGWIRWRIPGPLPGSWSVRLRGTMHFGIID